MKSLKIRQVLLACGSICLSCVVAQAQPKSLYFWSSAVGTQGLRAGVDGARLGTWGNGAYSDARRVQYEGASTLKVTTRNFREGVRFDLKTPLDIQPYRQSGYIRMRLKFDETAAAATTGPTPGGAPGMGGFGGGGFGGRTPRPAGATFGDVKFAPQLQTRYQTGALPPLGGMGGLPAEGSEPIVTGPPAQQTRLSQLLCTLVLENGVMEGTLEIPKQWNAPDLIDFEKVHPDANGWLMFILPLKQMRSTPNAGGAVKRMILSGNGEESFYLAQAAIVVETGEMTVSIRRLSDPPGTQIGEVTVKPGPLTLVAEVEAGAADPAIEWNFDADNVGNLTPAAPAGGASNPDAPGQPPVEGPKFGAGAIVGGGADLAEENVVGPRIDARGLVAKFEYPNEEQNYRVEVTVRDRSGKKEPVKASLLIKVRG